MPDPFDFPSCLMYAGFKRIAPDQNTGMDLNEPWITALELFHVVSVLKALKYQ